MYLALYRKWRPQALCRRDLPGAHHHAPCRTRCGTGTAGPRLPVHRLPRAPARPPAPKSWPRRSTACTRWTATPAWNAKSARGSKTARSWTWWKSTPPATTAWTTSGSCGRRPTSPPQCAKYRVYIIDEVHMLSTGGFQRPAEDHGGAAGPRDLYSGHHRGAQGARHHPVPLPAVRLQPDPAARTSPRRLRYVAGQEGFTLTDDARSC